MHNTIECVLHIDKDVPRIEPLRYTLKFNTESVSVGEVLDSFASLHPRLLGNRDRDTITVRGDDGAAILARDDVIHIASIPSRLVYMSIPRRRQSPTRSHHKSQAVPTICRCFTEIVGARSQDGDLLSRNHRRFYKRLTHANGASIHKGELYKDEEDREYVSLPTAHSHLADQNICRKIIRKTGITDKPNEVQIRPHMIDPGL